MAFGTALVDRARIVREEPQPRKVEGRTIFSTVTYPWFRARLTIGARPRTADPTGGRTRVESRPTLMYALRDESGEPVALDAEDQVEVESVGQASGLWRLDGQPQPIRKRRTVIGYEVTLRRVEQREFESRTV